MEQREAGSGGGRRECHERRSLPLQPLPGLCGAEVEEVRVAPLHLGAPGLSATSRRGELSQLLGEDQLPGQVQEEIPHLVPQLGRISGADGLVHLEHFLDQVGAQGVPGLGPVPGAPDAEVPDHLHGASKR